MIKFILIIIFLLNLIFSEDDIFYEIEMNNFSNVKRILKKIDIDIVDFQKRTPLMIAVKQGKLKITKYLIDELMDPYARDKNGWTCLDWAFYNQKLAVANYLIKKKVKVFSSPRYRKKSLILSIIRKDIFLLKYLVDKNGDINTMDEYNMTLLMHAVENNNHEAISFLLKNGAGLYNVDVFNRDIFVIATEGNNLRFLKYLFEKKKKKYNTKKLLKIAVKNNFIKIIKYLIQKSKNNKESLLKITFLESVKFSSLSCLEYCLDRGVDIDTADKNGKTALMYAAEKGNNIVFNYLINNGANIDLKDNSFLFGKSVLDYAYASQFENKKIIDFIKEIKKP